MEQDVSHQGSWSHPGSFPGLSCQGQVQNPRTQRNLESALPAAGFGSALCARISSQQCDIKYSCAEPALPLCHCPRVPREGADTAPRCPGTAQLPSGEPWAGETCSAASLGADGGSIWLPGVCTRVLFAGGQSWELL